MHGSGAVRFSSSNCDVGNEVTHRDDGAQRGTDCGRGTEAPGNAHSEDADPNRILDADSLSVLCWLPHRTSSSEVTRTTGHYGGSIILPRSIDLEENSAP